MSSTKEKEKKRKLPFLHRIEEQFPKKPLLAEQQQNNNKPIFLSKKWDKKDAKKRTSFYGCFPPCIGFGSPTFFAKNFFVFRLATDFNSEWVDALRRALSCHPIKKKNNLGAFFFFLWKR